MARGPPPHPHPSRPLRSDLLDCSILESKRALYQCVHPKHPYRRGSLEQHYQFRTPSKSLYLRSRKHVITSRVLNHILYIPLPSMLELGIVLSRISKYSMIASYTSCMVSTRQLAHCQRENYPVRN